MCSANQHVLQDHKTLLHPELGEIDVDCQALLVLTAPPHSEGNEKLQLLRVLGNERFPADTQPG